MKTDDYKILVLSDLKESAQFALKSAVSLAKMINGSIELFHVKKATDVITQDNQLSAMRSFNTEFNTADRNINALIKSIYKDYGIQIKYKVAIGNVKNEIKSHIKEVKPDIVVLGKRNASTLPLIGDSITQFVMNKYDGIIMIAANDHALKPGGMLSLGALNGLEDVFNIEFAETLTKHTNQPIKSFRIGNDFTSEENKLKNLIKTIEFVFEKNDNSISKLSSYIEKNNINLLLVNRHNGKSGRKRKSLNSYLREVIYKLNVAVLLTKA